jgi:hypothetical protein
MLQKLLPSGLALTLALVLWLLPRFGPPLDAQTPPPPTEQTSFALNDSRSCLRCHGMENFALRESALATPRDLSVPADSFRISVHGRLDCRQCHQDITHYPHTITATTGHVTCADDCHATDSEGKPYTHSSIVAGFASSVHGKGLGNSNPDAPGCLTCHGGGDPHTIARAAKETSVTSKMKLCVDCHDDPERMARNDLTTDAVESYRRSFHYKAIRFGETNTAVCQDCHTVHGVLPKDSTRSSIADANLPKTCGQSNCHPGAEMNFSMSGANHLGLRIERDPILWFEENFFLALTLGTMAMLAVGIALDVQRKFGWLRAGAKGMQRISGLAKTTWGYAGSAGRFIKRMLID